MPKIKLFTIANESYETIINDFLETIKLIKIIPIGSEKQHNGFEAPMVMIVYEEV